MATSDYSLDCVSHKGHIRSQMMEYFLEKWWLVYVVYIGFQWFDIFIQQFQNISNLAGMLETHMFGMILAI